MTQNRRRVFSGIQPSGNLHLGNYLGAIRRWVDEQGEKENFICVVDLHAVTVYQDPAKLRDQVRELTAMLLASGIDPEQRVALSTNRNPHLRWSDVPEGCRSFVILCVDPDVPTVGDDVNQEGRSVSADLPRTDFVHWLMVDVPADQDRR